MLKQFIFLKLIFSTIIVCAQDANDPLPRGSINIQFLEHLVKEKVDSVRRDHNLLDLRNDSTLYVAAADHAEYMNRNDLLTHYENDIPLKQSPSLRVKYHGGEQFSGVGENVLFTFAFIPVRDKEGGTHVNSTYDQLAYDMVNMWVHSPPHYRNMITPTYQLTGVAISYNTEKDKFYAAQVFGMIPGYDNGVENKTFFAYSNFQPPPVVSGFDNVSHEAHQEYHNWQLRKPSDSLVQCLDCINTGFHAVSTKLEIKNGNIIFSTEETELMKLLLDDKTDALAAEIVSYTPVDCGNPAFYTNPSRRNGQCIHNGRTLKPVYRKKTKSAFKKRKGIDFMDRFRNARADAATEQGRGRKWKAWKRNFYYKFNAQYFQVNLGKYPKDLPGGYYEINVLIIQENRLCKVIHFTGFCGEDWDVRPELTDITEFSTDSFQFQPKIRNRKFVIPFEKNKTEYKLTDIQPMLDSLGSDKTTVMRATIATYASVEGSEEANKQLQLKRATSIVSAIQSNQKDSIQYAITTSENWELFDQQVKTVPAFSVFKNKSHADVKQMLNDTALNRRLEPWLAQQRKAIVQLTVKQEVSPLTSCGWILEKWTQWMDSCKKHKGYKRDIYIDSLWRMQGYYYRSLLNRTADTSCLSQMVYPIDTVYQKLYYHDAWLKRYIKDTARADADKIYYKSLMRLVMGLHEIPYFPAVYAVNRRWIEGWKPDGAYYDNAVDEETIYPWLHWAQQNSPDSLLIGLDSLEIGYHFSMVKVYSSNADRNKRAAELFWIYNRFLKDSLSDSTALFLANYFTFYSYPELAVSILQPYAMCENPNHTILMQYIRFRYVHYEEDRQGADDYYSLLSWAQEILSTEEWCSMFVGPCNISFQVFDHEATRNLYCEECAEHPNYAESPERWTEK